VEFFFEWLIISQGGDLNPCLESGFGSYTHSCCIESLTQYSSPGGSTIPGGGLCCPSTDFLVVNCARLFVMPVVIFCVIVYGISEANVCNMKAEELDDRKVQTVPPGFHLIFLPFADDFRKLKLDDQLPRG